MGPVGEPEKPGKLQNGIHGLGQMDACLAKIHQ